MKAVLFTSFLLLSAQAALAEGPFGIDMGSDPATLNTTEEGAKVQLTSVPNPHPSFDTYFAWATPETGVCLIMALSTLYEDDRSGRRVRSDFAKFAAALDAKYGTRKDYDQHLGGIWKEADDWVMSIKQNERIFAADWATPPTAADHIAHVEMQVQALSSDTSVIKLFYKSDRFADCEKAIEAGANSSF